VGNLSVSLNALRTAESRINETAKRLSRFPLSLESGQASDVVELSTETVSLLQNQRVAEANLNAWRSQSEIQQRVLDLLA
jgi:hypothetical protein